MPARAFLLLPLTLASTVFVLLEVSNGASAQTKVIALLADDTVISESCDIRIPPDLVIADINDNGVLQIGADGITVRFVRGSVLRGAPTKTPGDELHGIGIRVNGHKNVTLERIDVAGYKVGVLATGADGFAINRAHLHELYRQHLMSTKENCDDGADWLYPHDNDSRQWVQRYGAGLCVERTKGAELRRIVVRDSQNGILLDRVEQTAVYDCDCSFLSGWGIGLWRSSKNTICRNAFDFCVRGYSHGIYNRGQDSAGMLVFEQCHDNIIAQNSVTHGGDGFFGFAGKEALGQQAPASGTLDYKGLGCNDNLLLSNEFSYAAAHGIEMTFGFRNRFIDNIIAYNGICGIWGGYSQQSEIIGNIFKRNGEAGYGLERGGINIEHSIANRIHDNRFIENRCGIHLWWDEDAGLMATPWGKANDTGCRDNTISFNKFERDDVALQLRAVKNTQFSDNKFDNVKQEIVADAGSEPTISFGGELTWPAPEVKLLGKMRPISARASLAGRDKIVMGEWGPWDYQGTFVRPVSKRGAVHCYEIFGPVDLEASDFRGEGLTVDFQPAPDPGDEVPRVVMPGLATIRADKPGFYSYTMIVRDGDFESIHKGRIEYVPWNVRVFSWTKDPRTDLAGWHDEAKDALEATVNDLVLRYENGGPKDLKLSDEISEHGPAGDHFGTIATTRVPFAKGKWQVSTFSDDGVRVTIAGRPVIDNWTYHGPTRDNGEFEVTGEGTTEVLVEHFEIDGYAILEVSFERLD